MITDRESKFTNHEPRVMAVGGTLENNVEWYHW